MGPHWRELETEIGIHFGREFEIACQQVLSPAWPGVRQASPMSPFDMAGLDLVQLDRHDDLILGVQCTTANRLPVLFAKLKRKIGDDLEKIRISGLTPRNFVYVVNAPGLTPDQWRELKSLVKPPGSGPFLAALVSPAELVTLAWEHVKSDLDRLIQVHHLTQHVSALQTVFKDWRPITRVPVQLADVDLTDASEAVLINKQEGCLSFQELFAPHEGGRVTLLTGMFGSGKSTAVDCLVSGALGSCFALPCRELPLDLPQPLSSTHVVRWLLAFLGAPNFQEGCAPELIFEAMLEVLSDPSGKKTVIFDALDEHRRLCTSDGFAQLVRAVGDLGCNIIFTIRREFVDTELGRYEIPLRKLCLDSALRYVRRIELLPWGQQQIVELIDVNSTPLPWVQATPDPRVAGKWLALREAVISGQARRLCGDCLNNPLLLTFLIEDVAENGLSELNRAELLFGHIRRKVTRDRNAASRPHPGSDDSLLHWTSRILTALMTCALCLDSSRGELSSLSSSDPRRREFETLSWDEVKGFFSSAFPDGATKDEIRACGIFIVRADPVLGAQRLYFSHKALQEFLVALAIECLGGGHEREEILNLVREIQEARRLRPMTGLARFVAAHLQRREGSS